MSESDYENRCSDCWVDESRTAEEKRILAEKDEEINRLRSFIDKLAGYDSGALGGTYWEEKAREIKTWGKSTK